MSTKVLMLIGGAAGASSGQLFAGMFVEWSRCGSRHHVDAADCQRWSWRPCFLSVGLICLLPLAIVWSIVPNDSPTKSDWKVDWLGALAIGAGLFLLLLSLTISQNSARGWKTSCEPPPIMGRF